MNLIIEKLGIQGLLFGLLEMAIIIAFGYLFYLFRKIARQSKNPIYQYLAIGFFFSLINLLVPTLITFSAGFWLSENNYDVLDFAHNALYFTLSFCSLICFIIAGKAAYKIA